jgi:16S rRNA (guanine527-N7)-methyltransferase
MEIGSENWKRLIIDGAEKFGISVDPDQARQFAVHALELLKWNRKINLTAITNPEAVAIKHFLDSIIPLHLLKPDAFLLDIGSGGGFPGMPLKIIMPSLPVTLIDASRKKVSFLNHIIRTLKLEKIEARHVRAQDLALECGIRNCFDVVISRALTSIENLVILAAPLMAEHGKIIILKGPEVQQEVAALCSQDDPNSAIMEMAAMRFSVDLKTYSLPYLGSQRTMVTLQIHS